ncbi:helix-turn-helix domain-containing protein [Pseudodesulfovibrio piezophilus]|uniref:Transcriptional regulator, AraC family n=1 Tax=Pseudodesulfovibrio piezophilus (strain DSM 21447 / JCM 15486 / C1TLV30) TaxID=1322246 RepID=M1WK86_PSEP2|nr:AraC family transcriptional regulator [Pseudodesulfovibrio piezophilus]CCH49166.1 Transcriptional regulator, AraC family [Pseudodesulfovibrio piezophilus C1TLV30]
MGKRSINADICFWRDPDLPGVEARFSSYNEEAFRKHVHAAYSVGLVKTGRTSFFLDGEMHDAEAGQVVLIEPNVVHACNPERDSCMTYRMFYVDETWFRSVGQEVFGSGAASPRLPRPVVDDSELYAHWRELHEAIRGNRHRLEKESLLVQGIADILVRYGELSGREQDSPGGEGAVEAIKQYLTSHLESKVNLDTLSDIAHVSRYHLLRLFHAKVGLPPHTYQNQLRVDLGKRLLATGTSISQVAQEAGFVDQSHFSRVFRQFTGATPRQYQRGASPSTVK